MFFDLVVWLMRHLTLPDSIGLGVVVVMMVLFGSRLSRFRRLYSDCI